MCKNLRLGIFLMCCAVSVGAGDVPALWVGCFVLIGNRGLDSLLPWCFLGLLIKVRSLKLQHYRTEKRAEQSPRCLKCSPSVMLGVWSFISLIWRYSHLSLVVPNENGSQYCSECCAQNIGSAHCSWNHI